MRYAKNKTAVVILLITAAVLYLCFVNITHSGVPCVFHLVTGLKCPGCGVTTMCAALIRGDLLTAFHANPFLLITLPLFFLVHHMLRMRERSLPSANAYPRGFSRAFDIVYLAALIAFGIIRNIS